jgi:general secretion pathway protein B
MSYILDALKRASAERERGKVPGLNTHTAQGPVDDDEARPGSVRWLLYSGAALLAAGLGWWLWPWWAADAPAQPVAVSNASSVGMAATSSPTQSAPVVAPVPAALPKTPPAPIAAAPVVTEPTAALPVAATTSTVRSKDGSEGSSKADLKKKEKAAAAKVATTEKIAEKDSNAAPEKTTAAKSATPASAAVLPDAPADQPAAKSSPTAANKVLTVQQLPDEVRRSLPALTVNASMYTEQASQRMLIINGQTVAEGASPAPEVVVERIGPRSAVMSFRGYRYQLNY